MTAWLLLVLGLLSLFSTASALFRFHRPAQAGFLVFFVSFVVSEYPLFHLGVQMVIAAVLLGGADRSIGIVGLIAYLISWVGLIVVRVRQTRARPTGEAALAAGLGERYLDSLAPERRAALRSYPERFLVMRPIHFDRTGIEIVRRIPYGDAKRNVLDVYRPSMLLDRPLPEEGLPPGGRRRTPSGWPAPPRASAPAPP